MRRNARGATSTRAEFETHVNAQAPRLQCLTHGVKQVRVPWAARSRFTLLMERLIIDLIQQSAVPGANLRVVGGPICAGAGGRVR